MLCLSKPCGLATQQCTTKVKVFLISEFQRARQPFDIVYPIAALLPDDLFEQLLPLIRVAADAKARGVTPDWESWLENWEAAHSPAFKKAMQAARADTRERTADEVFAEQGL